MKGTGARGASLWVNLSTRVLAGERVQRGAHRAAAVARSSQSPLFGSPVGLLGEDMVPARCGGGRRWGMRIERERERIRPGDPL